MIVSKKGSQIVDSIEALGFNDAQKELFLLAFKDINEAAIKAVLLGGVALMSDEDVMAVIRAALKAEYATLAASDEEIPHV